MLLMYLMYFVVVKHSSAALPRKRFVSKHVKDIIATPHHSQIVSFAIINLFSLFNTRAKPAPLSINERTTEYWNSYMNWINISYFKILCNLNC